MIADFVEVGKLGEMPSKGIDYPVKVCLLEDLKPRRAPALS
jgi:hypothetical protein